MSGTSAEALSRWGIQRDYLDNADQPARLSEGTVRALRASIGEPEPEVLARSPLVMRPGAALPAGSDEVELEDGTQVETPADESLELPYGYHWLHGPAGRRQLIISPGSCVLPRQRCWGWTAQLYATRSHNSWGIGDLGDLDRLTEMAAGQGAGFVLVNPLHAAGSGGMTKPPESSPYFPASRRFLNPIYLAVAQVPGARAALGARLDELDAQGRALNSDRHIDRAAVWQLKRQALRDVFDRTGAAESGELARWRSQKAGIEEFVAWTLLAGQHSGRWQDWPQDARRPGGPAARAVAGQHPQDAAFVAWLQWGSERQLQAARHRLPIFQDLPVGVDPGGADAWAYQDTLALDVSVGAPPDPFNQSGQDWGLPPFVPWRLRAANYQPFIEAIRSTMALSGGLRIDHVMGLFRLWWIPTGSPAGAGGYVRYPSADMLDIVALESLRANAPVVGEDLGTVEPGVREELAARNVLSYRLLWFQEQRPDRWPVTSLAAVSTHDLPTVAGLWDGSDLADQQAAGIDADEGATEQLRGLLVPRAGVRPDASVADAIDGAYRLLGTAASMLVAASVDDALAEPARPNMPGTVRRTNWSRALPVALDEFATHAGITRVAAVLDAATRHDEQHVAHPRTEGPARTPPHDAEG